MHSYVCARQNCVHVWLICSHKRHANNCFVSVATACACKNGVALPGVHCAVHGVVICASCNTGFTMNHARNACIRTSVLSRMLINLTIVNCRFCTRLWFDLVANSCTCKNGVGETGAGCPAHGAVKCASCNHGFTINHAKTECICTCPDTHEQQRNRANILQFIATL